MKMNFRGSRFDVVVELLKIKPRVVDQALSTEKDTLGRIGGGSDWID